MKINFSKKISKRRRTLFILVMLLILFMILLIFIIKKDKLKKEIESMEVPNGHYYNYKIPAANSVSDVYKGDIPAYKISNKVEMIFQMYLPLAYNDVVNMTDEELVQYYEKDKESIVAMTGLETPEEYITFIRDALKVGCDFSEYALLIYQKGSYTKNGNEETIKLMIQYKNGNYLNATMHIDASSVDKIKAKVTF